jgi:ribosomal protein S3
MAGNEKWQDKMNILYTDEEYQLLGNHAWVDVHTLTVHIMRGKHGVKVEIFPAAHDGVSDALASCEARWEKPDAAHRTRVVKRYVR